jgi:hypothetical protein
MEFWLALLASAVFVVFADMADFTAAMPVVDRDLPAGMIEHLGDAGMFASVSDDSAIGALTRDARAASHRGDRQAAIAAFKKVIATPDSLPKRAKLGLWDIDQEALRKHQACVELSDLYLELHDLRSALKFAELAHDTHAFHPPCACVDDCFALEDRINAIKSALASKKPIMIEPRSTVQARSYAKRRSPSPPNPPGRVR